MITETYREHTITNAVSDIIIYNPKITNGGDLAKDLQEKNSLTTLGNLYVAYRYAGDVEARKKSYEEILNEVEQSDFLEPTSDFYKALNRLINEGRKSEKH